FAEELEPLDGPSAGLAAPPAHWVASDGAPISSHPSHLLAREAQPYLVSSGWNELDAQAFISHLDRKALHASRDRNFKNASIKDRDTGQTRPKYDRPDGTPLPRCQYAALTHPPRTTVLVIDIDTPSGQAGGQTDALHPAALAKLNAL